MVKNSWLDKGGFYGDEAQLVADYGHDIAAHPQVVLKHLRTERVLQETTVARYRGKLLAGLWDNEVVGLKKLGTYETHGELVMDTLRKFYDGGSHSDKEIDMSFSLLREGFLVKMGTALNREEETASLIVKPREDLADIFEDVTGNKNIQNIVTKVSQGLAKSGVTEEDWIQALKYCADDSFMANMGILNDGKSKEDKLNRTVMKLKNPIILLRFHSLTMEAYRGNNPGNNHWLKENGPKCSSCGEEIPGSQNFTRVHGAAIHTSCIPEHLEKNPIREEDFAEYLWAVYNAMFPKKRQEG